MRPLSARTASTAHFSVHFGRRVYVPQYVTELRSQDARERSRADRDRTNKCTKPGVYSSMVPYRHSPDSPTPFVPWSPVFGRSPWAFSTRNIPRLSRWEVGALALAVFWADAWSFGLLASVRAPHVPIVLAGWLAVLLALIGRPRSGVVYGASVALAALSLSALAWNGGVALLALSIVAVGFVPAAARLRTFSVLEPLGSVLTFAMMAWHRGVRAAWQRLSSVLSKRKSVAVPWLELGVALGLFVLFGGLFALANPFVRASANDALVALGRVFSSFDRLLLRSLADVGFACAFLGLIRAVPGAAFFPAHDAFEVEATARMGRMATMTLVLQNALFAVYNSIDAVFLGARVAPPGMTLQKYAHDGAFWLTVTLAFVTVVAYAFRNAARTGPPLVRRLMNAWIAQGLVLGANVFFRLALHVSTSGLSDVRFVGAFGSAAVVCGMCAVWWAIRKGHSRAWILRSQATIFAGAVTVYALVPTHWLSAEWDVHAIQRGDRLPLVHANELSGQAESAPQLLALLNDDDPIVREGVAGLLVGREWSSSSYADRAATRSLEAERERMETMLRASQALRALAAAQPSGRETRELDERLAEQARERFLTYVRYMDDQDATISPRLPESGELLIRQQP